MALAYDGEVEPSEVIAELDSVGDLGTIESLEAVEVLGDGEELPEKADVRTFAARRVEDGMIMAVRDGDGVTVVKGVAAGDLVSTGAQMLWDALTDVYSRKQQLYVITKDLAWRWYHADSEKRAKIPVVPENDGLHTPLTNQFFTGAGDAQAQYAEWESYYDQYWPLYQAYKLQSFDGGTWTLTGNPRNVADFQEYAKWYNWFEGITESGGNASNAYPLTNPIAMSYVGKLRKTTQEFNNIEDVTGWNVEATNSNYESLNSSMNSKNYGYYYLIKTHYSNKNWSGFPSPKGFFIASETPITMTYEVAGTIDKSSFNTPVEYYNITITSETNINASEVSVTNNGLHPNGTVYNFKWSKSSVGAVGNKNTYTINSTDSNEIIAFCVCGSVSSGPITPNEPVYPTYPEPQTPQQPNITVNSPTYNTYTTNENTTTTVDLTPILNAVRIMNDNVQAGFDNVTESIETCCGNMRAVLEGWYAYIGDWLEMIYEELRTANRWLEGIYYNSDLQDIIVNVDTGSDGEGSGESAPIDMEPVELPDVDLSGEVETLSGVFPFCIPHDLATIYGVISAEPVTPDLQVTFPSYGTMVQGGTFSVDLSGYDTTMAAVRTVEVLLFVVGLAFMSFRMLGGGG